MRYTADAPEPIPASTIPIYHSFDEESPPIQDRSGVLVRLGGRHFVFSAEHDCYLATGGDWYTSPNGMVYHETGRRGPETVKMELVGRLAIPGEGVDLIAAELGSDTVATLLESKQFLAAEQLRRTTAYDRLQFSLLGYPLFLSDEQDFGEPDARTVSQLCWFDTTAAVADRRPNAENLLFLRFPGDLADPQGNEIQVDEELKGMSGCGIWLTAPDPTDACPNGPYLAGVFHRFTEKENPTRVIIGTKLNRILHHITEKWPDTEAEVQTVRTYP